LYIQQLAQFIGDKLPAFFTDGLTSAKLKTLVKNQLARYISCILSVFSGSCLWLRVAETTFGHVT
jgi:hypothetical protein